MCCRAILLFIICNLCWAHTCLFHILIALNGSQGIILLLCRIILAQLVETVCCVVKCCHAVSSARAERGDICGHARSRFLVVTHNVLQLGCDIDQRVFLAGRLHIDFVQRLRVCQIIVNVIGLYIHLLQSFKGSVCLFGTCIFRNSLFVCLNGFVVLLEGAMGHTQFQSRFCGFVAIGVFA